MADAFDLSFAASGVVNETGTTEVTGNFYLIDVLADATFAVFTEVGATGDALTGTAWPAGTKFYNAKGITAFTMSSGAVRAYKL
jgi:hypothetical protein